LIVVLEASYYTNRIMQLDEREKKEGIKFIVGTWQVDFIVNPWSNNLEHIPASEFKSQDGKAMDLSQITWEFFEDHTMKLKNGAGQEESGTWEQTSSSKFSYTCDKFFGMVQDPEILKNFLVLEKCFEGGLVFSVFLAVHMKKIAEGVVTKEPDIGEIEPTPEDLQKKEIVGRWKVYQTMAEVDGKFGIFTRAEVEADLAKKKASEAEAADALQGFGIVVEFTEDHKVLNYMPIPPSVPKEEVEKAVAAGAVKIVDGMILEQKTHDWKYVKGDYWYDSGEHRVVFDEVQSSWDKITPNSEGHINFRILVLEKM